MPDVLGTKQQFKQHFQIPIEKEQDRPRARELRSLIAPFILRRTKAEVVKELPNKTELIKELEFSDEQHKLYQGVQHQVESRLLNLFQEQGVERSKLAFLDALLKLRQICCHPQLVDKSLTDQHGAKFEWLAQHLPVLLSEGRKIIIFSQFTSVLDLIAEQCQQQKLKYTMLTGQTRQRDKAIEAFTQGKCNVFLISLKSWGNWFEFDSSRYGYPFRSLVESCGRKSSNRSRLSYRTRQAGICVQIDYGELYRREGV